MGRVHQRERVAMIHPRVVSFLSATVDRCEMHHTVRSGLPYNNAYLDSSVKWRRRRRTDEGKAFVGYVPSRHGATRGSRLREAHRRRRPKGLDARVAPWHLVGSLPPMECNIDRERGRWVETADVSSAS